MRREDIETACILGAPFGLFAVFLILKLTGVVGWSWWAVTAPVWMAVIITLVLLALYVTVLVIRYRRVRRR